MPAGQDSHCLTSKLNNWPDGQDMQLAPLKKGRSAGQAIAPGIKLELRVVYCTFCGLVDVQFLLVKLE